MPYHLNDRWLWLGFGIFAALAAHGIRFAIKDIVRLTRIDPVQLRDSIEPSGEQGEAPEDFATLATLMRSPNASIADSAISLFLARCWRDPRIGRGLDEDMDSGDARRYWRAKRALTFMRAWYESTGRAESESEAGESGEFGRPVTVPAGMWPGEYAPPMEYPVEESWEVDEEQREGEAEDDVVIL
nr:hypothetical protein CFP56_52193 [Quercus suber]POF19946.1 hypothetical protein CFP56_52195 [Quercus suber]